jgi:asparaginyl-tRNA synthetase
MNKSFRSEHSNTNKHISEFTHLEIEMINIELDDLMNISEKMIKYVINKIFITNEEDLINLNKFTNGLIDRLNYTRDCEFKRMKYVDVINEINSDIKNNKKLKIKRLEIGDDLGSDHENYITAKYNIPIFVTHYPISIKSFYMKQCDDGYCESYDLLMSYGIGELIGASMREDNYDKLIEMMKIKNVLAFKTFLISSHIFKIIAKTSTYSYQSADS